MMIEIVRRMKLGYGTKGRFGTLDYRPALPEQVEQAEQRLGFCLPILLAQMYVEVSNGGFGPDVVGLENGAMHKGLSIVEWYEMMCKTDPDDPAWEWPAKLVPFVDWGCAMKSCIDCGSPPFKVIRFDPNGHVRGSSWREAFRVESPSLEEWIEAWMNDVN